MKRWLTVAVFGATLAVAAGAQATTLDPADFDRLELRIIGATGVVIDGAVGLGCRGDRIIVSGISLKEPARALIFETLRAAFLEGARWTATFQKQDQAGGACIITGVSLYSEGTR